MIGAVSRYALVTFVSQYVSASWVVFGVNVVGCFAAGMLVGYLMGSEWFQSVGRALLIVGFLGSFTTFSAFSIDVIALMQVNKYVEGLTYLNLTTTMCVLATWLGMRLVTN